MTRLFENDDVILEKDENDEYHLSFVKDGHYKGEEHYPFYGLTPWANRLPDCSAFGIDWEGPQGWGPCGICDASRRWPRYPLYRSNGIRLCQRTPESIC